jgi:hypothetical protein
MGTISGCDAARSNSRRRRQGQFGHAMIMAANTSWLKSAGSQRARAVNITPAHTISRSCGLRVTPAWTVATVIADAVVPLAL